MSPQRAFVLLGAIAAAAAGALAAPHAAREYWLWREENILRRGHHVARHAGCFGCHGPEGQAGIANPGSDERVPPWQARAIEKRARDEAEVREYIEDGLPRRVREERARAEWKARIPMPAYKDVLSKEEIDAVLAYVLAAAGAGGPKPGTPEARGREVARERGCFGCHGPDGAGGISNPGSLKGYIPGWRGPDYDELVRDDAELRAWILEGVAPRLADDPYAQRFLERQKIAMPPYRGVLKDEEVADLVAYIRWLRAKG